MRFIVAITLIALGFLGPVSAAPAVEGTDYVRINPQQPTLDPKKLVVTEFFSYQCPHCFAFAKPFATWTRTLPTDVLIERVPVSFGRPTWEPAARAYLTLVSMKAIGKVDDAIFEAIHRQGIRLESEQAMAAWLATRGVDAKAFTAQYESFGIDTQLKSADLKSRSHQIPSIPAIVIDGRYLVALEDNGGFQAQLAVVSELINRVRKERAVKPG
jgi:protein dithiol oxidoreductase (disulfide-forming)